MSADDLPGMSPFGDQTTSIPGIIDVLYARFLIDSSSQSTLGVELVLPAASVPVDQLAPAMVGENLLRVASRTFRATSGADTQNFRVTGPLGIDDDDLSVTWDANNSQTGRRLRVYGDVFMQGRLLVVVIWATPAETADAAPLAVYAQLQQTKILNSALPAALVGAGR